MLLISCSRPFCLCFGFRKQRYAELLADCPFFLCMCERASNELELVVCVYECVFVGSVCVWLVMLVSSLRERNARSRIYIYTYTTSYMHRYVWKYNKHTRRTKDKKQNKQKAIVAAAQHSKTCWRQRQRRPLQRRQRVRIVLPTLHKISA